MSLATPEEEADSSNSTTNNNNHNINNRINSRGSLPPRQ